MKAMTIPRHGGADVLAYVTDWPLPEPAAGEALVRVEATGVNRVDTVIREGYPGLALPLPHVPGGDIAGAVDAVGAGVDPALLGTRVVVYPIVSCGASPSETMCDLCREGKPNLCLRWQYFGLHRRGGYAEHVAVPAANLVPLPDNVSMAEAVALPVAGLTAWHAVSTVGDLQPGQTFFIWGGAGGLGTMAIQMAKHRGATVIATASTDEKLDVMRALGADVVINRLREDVPARVREVAPVGVDVAVDYVGPATFGTSIDLLKKGGTLLLCGIITGRETTFSIHGAYFRHLNVRGLYLGTREEMREVVALAAAGTIRPVVRTELPLADAAEAHRRMERGDAVGKIVLRP